MEPPTSGRRLHANSTPCELMSSVKPSGLTCLEPACVIDNGSRILKRVPLRWSTKRPRMLSSMVAHPTYNPGGPSVTVGKTIHLCLLPRHDLPVAIQLTISDSEHSFPSTR